MASKKVKIKVKKPSPLEISREPDHVSQIKALANSQRSLDPDELGALDDLAAEKIGNKPKKRRWRPWSN